MKKKWVVLLISSCFLVFSAKPALAQMSVGITVSANMAPPPLVVYDQPACPVDGYLWCPGYWAYTENGYFWVPGVWVMPPQYGYLWTPPYWGFEAGMYGFHSGYWGPHIGFYGGVNYGYGYWGSGYGGGRWEGNRFRYNTAVVNVNRTVVHNTYVDKTVIVNNNYRTTNRVSYNGGPGGLAARPSSHEMEAVRESHVQATAEQNTHIQQARSNKAQFASVNHGQPSTVVMSRPNNPQQAPSNHNADHVNTANNSAANNHVQRNNHPTTVPQHYVPLNQPVPAQKEHAVPQQHEYSRQQHNNNPQEQHYAPQQQHMAPQQQHSAPQQEHMAPQQQHSAPQQQHMAPQQQHMAPQQQHAAPEPHNSERPK